jgi:hypothetical protein
MDNELDERIKAVANWFLKRGISVIPIGKDKIPALKEWGSLIDEPMKGEWNFPGCNLAIICGETNGVSVVDCDSIESAIWWRNNRPKTPLMVRSKRGVHYYYAHPPGVYIKQDTGVVVDGELTVDIKASRNYCLFAPSYRSGHQYSIIINDDNPRGVWIDPKDLPPFDPAWRPERERKDWAEGSEIKDMRAYMSKVFSIEGQQGDKSLFRLICIMEENGITEADAQALLCEWNSTNAKPEWSISELVRKLKKVYA